MLENLMEVKVLDNCKVEDSKREVYRGRASQLEWRRVRRSNKNRLRK